MNWQAHMKMAIVNLMVVLIMAFTASAIASKSLRISGQNTGWLVSTHQLLKESEIELVERSSSSNLTMHCDHDAPVRLDLVASGMDTNWSKKDAESAVLSVFVDGKYDQDVVLWGGERATRYALLLGKMNVGDHALTFQYAKDKSTPGAHGIRLINVSTANISYSASDNLVRWANQYAPILIGRDGLTNNHDDTPLALFYEHSTDAGKVTTIQYGYVFSNEDGGDASQPARQQARWGRLTDIQHVFTTRIDVQGKLISEEYEAAGHIICPFKGEHDSDHPLIVTCTDNNLVSDHGDGPLRFKMPADYELRACEPMGELMRKNPAWFQTMEQELIREDKIDFDLNGSLINGTKLFQEHKMGDPKDYLYVQYYAVNAETSPLAAKVRLRSGAELTSDFGIDTVALNNDGWNQTAVLLPRSTTVEQISDLTFVARGSGKGAITKFGHLFMLDQNGVPHDVKIRHLP